jgi:hypothetical protein
MHCTNRRALSASFNVADIPQAISRCDSEIHLREALFFAPRNQSLTERLLECLSAMSPRGHPAIFAEMQGKNRHYSACDIKCLSMMGHEKNSSAIPSPE